MATLATARLAQSAERKALNLVVVGSSPTVGAFRFAPGSMMEGNMASGGFPLATD